MSFTTCRGWRENKTTNIKESIYFFNHLKDFTMLFPQPKLQPTLVLPEQGDSRYGWLLKGREHNFRYGLQHSTIVTTQGIKAQIDPWQNVNTSSGISYPEFGIQKYNKSHHILIYTISQLIKLVKTQAAKASLIPASLFTYSARASADRAPSYLQ